MWKSLGAQIIDADALARLVTGNDSPCLEKLVSAFSEEILNEDKSLNRKALGKLAFSSKEKTDLLTSITHPYILDLCYQKVEEYKALGTSFIIIDAPLLFESQLDTHCDLVISVVSDKENRKQRIMHRDTLSEEDAFLRMNQQFDNDFYVGKSNVVLYNNHSVETLKQNAKELWTCMEQVAEVEDLPKSFGL